jgi:hypothetical protein
VAAAKNMTTQSLGHGTQQFSEKVPISLESLQRFFRTDSWMRVIGSRATSLTENVNMSTVAESVVAIVEGRTGISAYSHMVLARDHLVKWLADPVYRAFVSHERAMQFFNAIPKATAAWIARIQYLKLTNPAYLKFVIESVRGTFAFDAAVARMAAQEAALTQAARMAALNATAAATKGTLVAGAGTTIAAVVVPVIGMIAVQMALGAGYYQAREQARKEGYAIGFSKGFITGLLKWELRFTIERFWDNAVGKNAADEAIPKIRANAHNQALIDGRVAGLAKNDEEKKDYLLGLHQMTTTSKAGWTSRSDDWMEQMRARQVQISYVIALAGAAQKNDIVQAG